MFVHSTANIIVMYQQTEIELNRDRNLWTEIKSNCEICALIFTTYLPTADYLKSVFCDIHRIIHHITHHLLYAN